MKQLLNEAKDLKVYKALVTMLGDYSDSFPATGVSKMFKMAIDKGMSILPKDKRALDILASIVSGANSTPSKVTKLLNVRFADLDISVRPIVKNGRSKEVAFWQVDGKVFDKVLSLLNQDGKNGYWSDMQGTKVILDNI